jgi:hypothetical protein
MFKITLFIIIHRVRERVDLAALAMATYLIFRSGPAQAVRVVLLEGHSHILITRVTRAGKEVLAVALSFLMRRTS